jgi:putative ubiquitin-RnfH superfamily antitoxin RatB of RatAB toxin-antitoxin module
MVFSPKPRVVQELALQVPLGCTVAQALALAAPQWGLGVQDVALFDAGVWGKVVPPQYVLRAGDRVELYRSLTVDPKVARRARFVRQGAKSAGLFSTRRAGGKAGY